MNRPQYFNSTPPGFRDVPYVKPLGAGSPPQGFISGGAYLNNYTVTLDNDAPQLFRSFFIQGIEQGQADSVHVQMRGADGVFLTDGYVPIYLLAWGAGSNPPDGGSGRCKVFEPELYCPAGSILVLDFFAPAGGFTWPGLMEFRGVKRFKGACAA